MTIISHYSQVDWDSKRWPNFSPEEPYIACKCCGEFYMNERLFDKLQRARNILGKSMTINSGHRCVTYNSTLDGASSKSQHLKLAFDISVGEHDRCKLLKALVMARFTSFGFYETFIHVDDTGTRMWSQSKKIRRLWEGS